tara:strand:+ start:2844 stop:3134 length:291 start_codon:yes stop_codon:yes gene_type:complete
MLVTGIVSTNFSATLYAEETLNKKITDYCQASNRSHQCISEQSSAAEDQRQLFLSAFRNKDLGAVADIARCTKTNTEEAGINYVASLACLQKKQLN